MENTSNISRRKFITSGALTLSGIAIGLPSMANILDFKPVRVGLIGTGSRGAGLATLIKDMPGLSLMACCDTIPEHLKNGMKLAEKGAKAYSDYRKLLEDKSIDAVIIATPLFLHYSMSVDALEAGKHIYLEKSLAYDIPQTLDLVKRVKASKLVFQVGYQYRYYGLYQKIKEIMSQNWLGKVTHFECQYNQNSSWRKPIADPKLEREINWRMYREYCGGPLSELCAHQIDMVNYLTDSHPIKVMGMGSINYWKDGRDTYDNIRTVYEYPGQIKASVTSVLSNAYNGYNIRILGDKATVEIQRNKAFIYAESTNNQRGTVDGVTGATIKTATQGKAVELQFEKEGIKSLEPTIYALQDFLTCINLGNTPVSNVETARNSSIAIHIGNKAADTGNLQFWKPEYSI